MQKQKGFTLIELMVVIAVIALLASVVMYSTSEAKLKADDAHMKTESDQVAKAISLFKEENDGKVPGALGLAGSTYAGQMLSENDPVEEKKQAYQTAMQDLVNQGYISEVPTSPDGSSYGYMVTADGKSAVFVANLKTTSSSGGGSGSKNSCDVVNVPPKTYTTCITTAINYYNWNQGVLIESNTCQNANYNPETQDCFYITQDNNYSDNCTCGVPYAWSPNAIGNFPQPICTAKHYSTYYKPCAFLDVYRSSEVIICSFTGGGDAVCDGASDSDYCQCI